MNDFIDLIDLASERLGGVVMAANDEFFAPKEALLKECAPIFTEGQYTERGKWMDGWETRRRREPGYDWCLIRLGLPGVIQGVIVDTTHFKGNYPEACSLDGCALEGYPDPRKLATDRVPWIPLLPRTPLNGDTPNLFAVEQAPRTTHVRLNIFPDGGVARLRVHGTVVPDWTRLVHRGGELDLAAVEHGGLVLAASDMFFGSRHHLIMPGQARNMADGWETRRRRGPGHDWVIVQLGAPGEIRRAIVDTTHFKGNAPGRCSVEACDADGVAEAELMSPDHVWKVLLPEIALQPHTRHVFEAELQSIGRVTHARLNIFPDGGVGRLRLFGVARRGRATDT